MVPKIHQKGTSFRGAARYLLGDKGSEAAERVAWTENRNVASRNPETCWRVMAATSMDQERLKQQAGVPNSGRKSNKHVLHFSLSWHAEEAPGLTRAEMMRAANTMLHVMQAQEHQALIVCHTDKLQPHIHVLVNRVHPNDGRVLSSSFEKLKASKWAQKYEEQRGKIYCEQRVINNAARDRGEYTRGQKDQPRVVHDIAASSANDNERKQKLLEEHRRQAHALKEAERRLKDRHAQAWAQLQQRHRQMVKLIAEKTRQVIGRNQQQIRDRFRPLWEYQHHEHQAELRAFELREARALGRMKNAFKSIDFRSLIGQDRQGDDGKARTIAEAFKMLGDAGARLQVLKRQQEAAKQLLESRQRREELAAAKQRRAEQQKYLGENRRRFEAERSSLVLTQSMEKAKLKAQWLEKGRRLRAQWRELRPKETKEPAKRRPLVHEFAAAARPEAEKTSAGERSQAPPTRPANQTKATDLAPKAGAEEAAKWIDQWRELRQRRFDRDYDRGRDRDEDRER